MSRYNKLINPAEDPQPATEEPEYVAQPKPAIPENEALEEEVFQNFLRIRRFCKLMIITSFIIPVLSW